MSDLDIVLDALFEVSRDFNEQSRTSHYDDDPEAARRYGGLALLAERLHDAIARRKD